ncbi:MAG: DUF3461 family protein [Woeseiaceae bacterium]|nr:DUF3461 family protein [Woeseiaceae bacterium]
MTDKYPTLTEMGVESHSQINKYYVTSINYVDILRIAYDRPEGSLLPDTRSYKFPRVAGKAKDEQSKETTAPRMHPKLRDAIGELDKIISAHSSKETIAAEILAEIALLEEDIAFHNEAIKTLVRKIPDIEC